MIGSGHIIDRQTSKTISSTDTTYEAPQSEYAMTHTWFIEISAEATLVGGVLKAQAWNPTTNEWSMCPQKITCIENEDASEAAAGIDKNTASAAFTDVGAILENASGIDTISELGEYIITAPGLGTKVRLFTDATSGTGTMNFTYIGMRPRTL